ncbi:type II secretion system (T2SS), E [Candidatus Magnetobacterium bavaricum]|uniref:Type II secretion system (T2SS), E n=1 Tax=Candidatus Magnetobacterium bavaricum TaxID=29290 RepID=A0A0F3GML8_9BACT|nr:type II secretion system (T2SS), E [Candidatus Magnetobacterium bavaricum]
MDFVDVLSYTMFAVKALLYFTAALFFIGGLDEFIVDVHYAIRSIYRRVFVLKKYPPLKEEQHLSQIEQPIALMIPAWNESAVIQRMLENTIQTLNYSNYYVFVGTYPNDMATQREVETLREKYSNVIRIVCQNDGPTNKADCLNWIYRGILLFEKEHNITFPIFVMDDAEDIMHPYCFKLFNYLMPRKDMVQLPVIPLEPLKFYKITQGHYIDEFSENHYKNMVIRESLKRGLPSAGVGCAFSRRTLEISAQNQNDLAFGLGSLTEDYEIGLRLKKFGVDNQIFVKHPIKKMTRKKSLFGDKIKEFEKNEYIAIRERFPDKFWAAVRQKSRWIAGISLQGWESLGWKGDMLTKYMLFKDRKALITSQINMFGYFLFFLVVSYFLYTMFYPDAYYIPPLVVKGTFLWYLVLVDSFFMLVRFFQRMFFVYILYDFKRALLTIPGFFWGNIINFFATNRAIHMFVKYLITGKIIAWDHTAHTVPTEAELLSYRKKLGEMLLEKKYVKFDQLEDALVEQKKSGRNLGEILVAKGYVKENDLVEILGAQLRIDTTEIDVYNISIDVIRLLPKTIAIKYSVFPTGLKGNTLMVATNKPLNREDIESIKKEIDRPIEMYLATRGDVAFAIQRGYQRLEQSSADNEKQKSILGQTLIDKGLISIQQLTEAIRVQRQTYMRLGDILMDSGFISADTLNAAMAVYSNNTNTRLGDFLVQNEYVTHEQLQQALHIQSKRYRRLGDILVEMGFVTEKNLQEALNA